MCFFFYCSILIQSFLLQYTILYLFWHTGVDNGLACTVKDVGGGEVECCTKQCYHVVVVQLVVGNIVVTYIDALVVVACKK